MYFIGLMLQKYITFMKNGKKEVKKLPIYAEKHYLCAAKTQKYNNYIYIILEYYYIIFPVFLIFMIYSIIIYTMK